MMTSAGTTFRRVFGYEAQGLWAAPGRVNLIGEHTDYNDGLVLPFAIAERTEAAIAPREDGHIRVCSEQNPGEITEVKVSGLFDQVVLIDFRWDCSCSTPTLRATGSRRRLPVDARSARG